MGQAVRHSLALARWDRLGSRQPVCGSEMLRPSLSEVARPGNSQCARLQFSGGGVSETRWLRLPPASCSGPQSRQLGPPPGELSLYLMAPSPEALLRALGSLSTYHLFIIGLSLLPLRPSLCQDGAVYQGRALSQA